MLYTDEDSVKCYCCHGIGAISRWRYPTYTDRTAHKSESENVCLIREKIVGWTCEHYMEREHLIDILTFYGM